jgi:hypothetical protein
MLFIFKIGLKKYLRSLKYVVNEKSICMQIKHSVF